MARRVLLAVLALVVASPVSAQWGDFLKDKLNEEAKRQAGKAVHESGDAAYGEAKKTATGKDAPAPAKPEAAAPQQKGAKPDAAQPQGDAAAPRDEVAAGEVYSPKFDFVPGDKVLVFDDFAETAVGEYPARWTIKDGGGNNAEVVEYKGRKWFKSIPPPGKEDWQGESTHWLRYDPKGDLPKKFTIELDADMAGKFAVWFTHHPNHGEASWVSFESKEIQTLNVRATHAEYGPVVKRISISVDGTYVKVYVGGERVLQDPDGVRRPVTRVGFHFASAGYRPTDHLMFTGLRLAEGGKDVTKALAAEGRIVVHGITFDTGSDVIKPESGGALRRILQVLKDDPSLLFLVEGHTDDQGGAAVNGPLSERRAAAVKAWLVAQGIDAKRLGTKGMGATKPIDTNDTQEGRAMNRRVEFVKVAKIAAAP